MEPASKDLQRWWRAEVARVCLGGPAVAAAHLGFPLPPGVVSRQRCHAAATVLAEVADGLQRCALLAEARGDAFYEDHGGLVVVFADLAALVVHLEGAEVGVAARDLAHRALGPRAHQDGATHGYDTRLKDELGLHHDGLVGGDGRKSCWRYWRRRVHRGEEALVSAVCSWSCVMIL